MSMTTNDGFCAPVSHMIYHYHNNTNYPPPVSATSHMLIIIINQSQPEHQNLFETPSITIIHLLNTIPSRRDNILRLTVRSIPLSAAFDLASGLAATFPPNGGAAVGAAATGGGEEGTADGVGGTGASVLGGAPSGATTADGWKSLNAATSALFGTMTQRSCAKKTKPVLPFELLKLVHKHHVHKYQILLPED